MRILLGRVPSRLAGLPRGLVALASSLIGVGLVLGSQGDPLRAQGRVDAPWLALAEGGDGLAAATLDLGVLVLILSPAAVLVVLLASFLRWGDRQMAALAGVILVVLALALYLGGR